MQQTHHARRSPHSLRLFALTLVLALAACSPAALPAAPPTARPTPQPVIRIGSKNFAEEILLGEMYSLLLENAGFQVERKLNIGPAPDTHAALERGDIDLYPEYTGTGLTLILGEPITPTRTPAEVYQIVSDTYKSRFNLTWLDPAPMNNSQAIAMTKSEAARLNIVTLSDFAARAREWAAQGTPLVLMGPAAFLTRPDGLPGIKSVYGDFEVDYRPVEIDQRYQELSAGEASAVVAFSTDGEIGGYNLAVLIDDKQFFPPYQVAPVVRQDALDRQPRIRSVLNPLAPLLNDGVLQELNFHITSEGMSPANVAHIFLTQQGLITPIAGAPIEFPVNYAGSYRISAFTTPQQLSGQLNLTLNPDKTAAVTWVDSQALTLTTQTGTGTWSATDPVVSVTITETEGQPLNPPATLQLGFDGHFITSVQVQNDPAGIPLYEYFISSGDRDPAVGELHTLLLAIPWLGFQDPGPSGDQYSETTRQTIVAFQQTQGLLPSGIVDAATWAALKNPKAPSGVVPPIPAAAPTFAPPITATPRGLTRSGGRLAKLAGPFQQACSPTVTIGGDASNLRAAPSTDAAALVVMPPNINLAALAINPSRTWYQVNYGGTVGWIFAELVTPQCADGLPTVDAPVPPPAPVPQAGTAPTATGDKIIYLTFDDGPFPPWTSQVLDLLAQNNAKVTFYQIGQQVGRNTDLLQQQMAAGHALGNHTWDHSSLSGISQATFNQLIMSTQQAQQAAGAYTWAQPWCMRPPYGATDSNTRTWAGQMGYSTNLWTIDTTDWSLPGTRQIIDHVLANVRSGSVILMHDGGGNRSQTVDAIRVLLPQLTQAGWQFVTNCR